VETSTTYPRLTVKRSWNSRCGAEVLVIVISSTFTNIKCWIYFLVWSWASNRIRKANKWIYSCIHISSWRTCYTCFVSIIILENWVSYIANTYFFNTVPSGCWITPYTFCNVVRILEFIRRASDTWDWGCHSRILSI